MRAASLVAAAMTGIACHDSGKVSTPIPEASPFLFPEEAAGKGISAVASEKTDASLSSLSFQEAAQASGLTHVYQNGEQGKSIMVETLGGGCGWLDYDRDGLWDLYLNQGGDATQAADASQPSDLLFRNLGGEFQNVTAKCGLAEYGYGQGVAVGDFDDDGFDDVYVTNVGANTLWKNQGDGTFVEVAADAGVNDPRWSSSAAWADLDLDGDLDLYVCNYLIYDPLNPLDCRTKDGKSRICHPQDLEPWPDECYINQGNGTFSPEARQRGLYGEGNKALGVAVADVNNDRLPDIYVANDTTANFLFVNQGEGRFRDLAILLGCAVDRNGAFQASMGLGVADVDRNGLLDIYSTHYHNESNTLYQNLGAQGFLDVTARDGLHSPTVPYLGFGTVIADFNQDGRQEIFVTNGHVENYPGNPLHQMRPQLLAQEGSSWRDCGAAPGAYFEDEYVGRGVAWCDYDNDGDADLAVVHQNEPAALLRNESDRGSWLKLEFRGRESNRRGIGCRAIVRLQEGAAGAQWMQELAGGTSYTSSHQPALIFGFGRHSGPCEVEILWPSGRSQILRDVAVNQALVIEEPRLPAAPSMDAGAARLP
ncbi:MAG: CRTAC1 family protein [Planctomycetes bacterium]|nr:CRTAC1 family protein [Planctomycetota bacterium]